MYGAGLVQAPLQTELQALLQAGLSSGGALAHWLLRKWAFSRGPFELKPLRPCGCRPRGYLACRATVGIGAAGYVPVAVPFTANGHH